MTSERPGESPSRAEITDDVISQFRTLGAETSELARRFATVHQIDHTGARAVLAIVEAGRHGRAITAGVLGRELGLSSAAVTALVDRLVDSGHVTREADPDDRRRVLLRLNSSAERLGPAYFGPLVADLRTQLGAFDDHELRTIHTFLVGAIRSVAQHRASDSAST